MTGAAVLAASAALCGGSGLVTLAAPRPVLALLAKKLPPEIMTLPLEKRAAKPLLSFITRRRVTALALGPGLGRLGAIAAAVREVVRRSTCTLVLDADGLNAFAGKPDLLKKHRSALILTPHDGEFRRLFSKTPPPSLSERSALAKKWSRIYDVLLVLKGHETVVSDGHSVYVNDTGNPGMAKGGSGDVLTGLVAAFAGQGLSAFQAAAWGVYFHGLAGDLAVKKTGQLSMTASDLLATLPQAFRKRR